MSHSFIDLVDLAAERLGAAVVAANDEFFAAKENLIKRSAAEWREGAYTERGKWMDGWETRRRRDTGDRQARRARDRARRRRRHLVLSRELSRGVCDRRLRRRRRGGD